MLPIQMAKAKTQKSANGSAPNFAARLAAATFNQNPPKAQVPWLT